MAAYSYDSKRDEAYLDGPLSGPTTSLLRIAGGWGNISGPSIYMLRSLVAGSAAAISFGLSGATLSAIFLGTASIPFMISATFGFVIGVVGFYKDCMSKALLNVQLYPRLLQLHMDANFPSRGFRQMRANEFRAMHFSRNWTLRSMLLVSWLTAQPALDQIMEAKEKILIDEAIEGLKGEDGTGAAVVDGQVGDL